MIDIVKKYIDKKYKLDGYNLGCNIGEIGDNMYFIRICMLCLDIKMGH